MILTGSICLSNIPREQMKKIKCKDGVERIYVNVAVIERREKSQFGHTHFITCSPKKEERVEGRNYICGDLKEFAPHSWCITVGYRMHNRCCACAYQLLCKRTTAVVRPKI